MLAGDLRATNDVSDGAWIASALHGDFGAVTLAVPSGYPAYVRICHPASDRDGRGVSWSAVAGATGRTAHPLMQWHALVGSPDPFDFTDSLWPGGDPERGNLARHPLEVLCGPLGEHTIDAAHCFFGVWIGWSWVHGGGVTESIELGIEDITTSSTTRPTKCAPAAFSAEELSRPRLQLPGRDYVLLSGPLSAAIQIGDPGGLDGFEPKSPNLLWPADRGWFLASEIDFDSTLVGGPADLIRDILRTPALDAWPVEPDDSLAYDADRINQT